MALRRPALPHPEVVLLIAIAGVLDLWRLSINRKANTFYAAAVHSMAASWHDFLYNAMDRAAVMSVDKPPLSDWIQALSVRAFGFNSWALLAPQAAMGIIATVLMYDLVRRTFGRAAGFAAACVLATTPTIVAMSRHNNPDELLVLLSVAATWCLLRALETDRTRWLVATGVFVGLGFETKMGVALMVVPGFALAWTWAHLRRSLGIRRHLRWIGQLVLGGICLGVVGLAWPVFVWLTPASERPWISSTNDNSIWQLIVGYNGLGRIGGQSGSTLVPTGPSRGFLLTGLTRGVIGGGAPRLVLGPRRPPHVPGHGLGAGSGATPGNPGVLRLLDGALGGQVSWLIGAAVVALLGLGLLTRLRRGDPRTGFLLAIGPAFVIVAVVWSAASGIFHPYYMSFLAPWMAALIGAGVGLALRGRRARILAPALLAGALVTELVVLGADTDGDLVWMKWLALGGAVVCATLLAFRLPPRLRAATLGLGSLALLAAPATYAAQTLGHPTSRTFPIGGPIPLYPPAHQHRSRPGVGGSGGHAPLGGPGAAAPAGRPRTGHPRGRHAGPAPSGDVVLNAAAAWVQSHGGGVVAVESQSVAANSMLAGHDNVAGIGGFSGVETSVNLRWIQMEVAAGKLSYVLGGVEGNSHISDGRIGSARAVDAAERTAPTLRITSGHLTFTLYQLGASAPTPVATPATLAPGARTPSFPPPPSITDLNWLTGRRLGP